MNVENILLVYPEFETSFWSMKYLLPYLNKKSSMPPLGILTAAGMFPKNYDLRIVDMNVRPLTDDDLEWADAVFTSTMIVQRRSLGDVAARCKTANIPIIACGPHPTSYWQEIEGIDHFLLGEVEETLLGFLDDLENGNTKYVYLPPKERPAITQTPLPRYDLINMRDYGSMLLQFSRGCPFDCEFCDITKLYGRVPRTKTNEQMLAEFQLLYDLGHRGSLFLVDDNFIGNRRDALRFLNALIPWQRERNYPFNLYTEASMNLVEYKELMKAMVAAGFTSVFIGIETPTAEALITTKKKQNVGKNDPQYPLHAVQKIQSEGMDVMGGFILGLDGEPPNVFDLHIQFIQAAGIPIAMEGLLTVLKGTDLYYRMEREGRLLGDTTGTSVNVNINFLSQMPEEVLTAGYKRVLNTIYDRSLRNYFERCWNLFQTLDQTNAPRVMSTPLTTSELLSFITHTCRQLFSEQGPAYLHFLGRVLLSKPALLREALALGAKGHHLRKVTEQVTAVDDFRHFLVAEFERIREDLAQYVRDSNAQARVATMLSRIQAEYMRIHEDFRHNVKDARDAFVNSINQSVREYGHT